VEETSGLDPAEKYFKTYAPGIGLIQDEDLLLTHYRIGETEEKVAPADLPPAVRRTLRQHLAGGQVVEIEREIVAGTVVYEAEVIRAGKEVDIRISATGDYLGIEQDDEAKDADDQEED
jgi:hypothetical protein